MEDIETMPYYEVATIKTSGKTETWYKVLSSQGLGWDGTPSM